MTAAFQPPTYPYDQLNALRERADQLAGGAVDLSVGTPCDPPPADVLAALRSSEAARGYPASVGSLALRRAAAGWMGRRFGVEVPDESVAACVGTKEFVGTLPSWLRLRYPDRDTVLFPAISYPTYSMGAALAGCRAVPVPARSDGCMDLAAVDDAVARRALLLWVNSPSNPTGDLDDLTAVARWGRSHQVPVFSDECYTEFTWAGSASTILEEGLQGVVAVHSLSKRSNMAGLRVGFFAGDPDLVQYLAEVRKHVGMMVPGPVQDAAVVALEDDSHVEEQRSLYAERLRHFSSVLCGVGAKTPMPRGGFYLWAQVPPGQASEAADAWAFTERLAVQGGAIVSPGRFFGEGLDAYVRVALVQPIERLDLVARRLGEAK